jgi:mannonate dehydratase
MSNYGESDQAPAARFNIQRRDFVKMALGGAALLASPGRSPAKINPLAPGIKIGTYAQNPTEEHMFYLRELGVRWITSGDITPATSNVEGFTKMREQWERGGLKVYNEYSRVAPSGNPVLNVPEIVLNLPGRDKRIEEFATYIRDLSKAGIYYMTYGFEGTGNWRSGTATLARGYTASDCNLSSPELFGGLGQLKKVKQQPLAFGRVFSRQEIWDN